MHYPLKPGRLQAYSKYAVSPCVLLQCGLFHTSLSCHRLLLQNQFGHCRSRMSLAGSSSQTIWALRTKKGSHSFEKWDHVLLSTWISTERESEGQKSKSKTEFFCNGSFFFKCKVFSERRNDNLKSSQACQDGSPGGFEPVLFISMKQLLSVAVSHCSSTFLTSS